MFRMSYAFRMTDIATNVTNLRPSADQVQIARAKFMHGLLTSER